MLARADGTAPGEDEDEDEEEEEEEEDRPIMGAERSAPGWADVGQGVS
jgi:hypothetical protein